MLTNQFVSALRRILRRMRSGDGVDIAGWGPFPQVTRSSNRVAPLARR